jgi:hypothetical protein
MRSSPLVSSAWLIALAAAGVAGRPGAAWSQSGSLKDIQRSVRERLLSEAGGGELLYTKVDFSHCAATIQTRTLKQPRSPETRVTTTFHLASLDRELSLAPGGPPFVLRVSAADGGPGLRQIQQVIDSGAVRESVTAIPALELRFQRRETAEIVRAGFGRIGALCRSDDPLLKAPGR